jgi:hypothetical protein
MLQGMAIYSENPKLWNDVSFALSIEKMIIDTCRYCSVGRANSLIRSFGGEGLMTF